MLIHWRKSGNRENRNDASNAHRCANGQNANIIRSDSVAVVDYSTRQVTQPNHATTYVYCDYKDSGAQSATNLLGTIARQLFEQKSSAVAEIRRFCGDNVSNRRAPTQEEWVALIRTLCTYFDGVYLFVDALVTSRRPCSSKVVLTSVRRMN